MKDTGTTESAWPTEIRIKAGGQRLSIRFDDGAIYDYPAEYLRVESPSAEVKGHGKGQEVTVPGKRNVLISAVEAVGNYAIRISFDDRHTTGIYSWTYLLRLARERSQIWQLYLEKLQEQGLSRD